MESQKSKTTNDVFPLFLISVFALFAIGERVFFDFGPNVELVTTVMILSGFYLGYKQSFTLVFIILAISDLIIGNSNIYLFTWSGFLIPALLASRFFKNQRSILNNSLCGLTTGIGANLFFYFWTNFGVWALDSWGMYTNNLSGLMASYINALPFLRYQLTSTFIFVPIGFAVFDWLNNLHYKYKKSSKIKLPSFIDAQIRKCSSPRF